MNETKRILMAEQIERAVNDKLAKKMEIHNNNCDGSNCKFQTGTVKYIPLSDGGLILCMSCYQHEMMWRRERNKELSKENRFDIPDWKQLETYT